MLPACLSLQFVLVTITLLYRHMGNDYIVDDLFEYAEYVPENDYPVMRFGCCITELLDDVARKI